MTRLYTLLATSLLAGASFLTLGTSCSSQSSSESSTDSVQVSERFALDSLVIDETYYDQQITKKGSSVQVSLTFQYPAQDTTLLPLFLRSFFGEELQQGTPKASMERYLEEIRKEYLFGDGNDFSEDELSGMQSTFTMRNEVSYSDSLVVAIRKDQFTYSAGAAHGLESLAYYTIDRKSRSFISEGDLFVDGYAPELAKILQRCILKENDCKSVSELSSKQGIDASEMAPNDNFTFTADGLVYCYNPYEIAPYAVGIVQVHVPYEELRSILRPGSLIYAYLPAN